MNKLMTFEDFKTNESWDFLTSGFVRGSIKTLYAIGNLLDNTKSLLTGKLGVPYKVSQKWANLTNFTLRLMLNMDKDLDETIEEYKRLNNSSLFKDIDYLAEILEIQIMDAEGNELRQKKLEKRLNKLIELSNKLKAEAKQQGERANFDSISNTYIKK
jgi:hypothetical protein